MCVCVCVKCVFVVTMLTSVFSTAGAVPGCCSVRSQSVSFSSVKQVFFLFFLQSKHWPWCCYVMTRSVITTPPPPPLSPPPLYCYETEFPISLDPPALRRNRTDQTDDLCGQSPPPGYIIWHRSLSVTLPSPLTRLPPHTHPPPPPPRQRNKNAADGPAKTLAVGL